MTKTISRAIKQFIRNRRNNFRALRRTQCQSQDYYDTQFQMSLRDWLAYHQKDVAFDKCTWMGVPTLKNPLDAWVYQEIIYEVKPDVVVEIGSYQGGSTLFLAHLLDTIGKGTIISIDIDRSKYSAQHDRIVTITGNSSSKEVVDEVTRLCEGKSVLVLHDGDHSREQVSIDMDIYSQLVTINSYLIIEDGIVDLFEPSDGLGLPNDGPLAAVEDFLRKHPDFIVDAERERYILTYNPRGFLKRIS